MLTEEFMLEFRALCDNDIPLIEKWLKTEHVKKWYEIPRLEITIEDWMSEIAAYKTEFKWITYLIVLYQGSPIGLCLYYKCADAVGEYFGTLELKGSYGMDYLIGEKNCIGKGLGKKLLGLLVDRIFSLPDAERVTADIDKLNRASERVLAANGFELFYSEFGQNRYVLNKKFC